MTLLAAVLFVPVRLVGVSSPVGGAAWDVEWPG